MARALAAGDSDAVYEGTVHSRNTLPLAFKQGGKIERIYVTVGEWVGRGQVIAQIGQAEAKAGLDQAVGEAAAARAGAERADNAAARSQGLDKAGALSAGEVQDHLLAASGARAKARSAAAAAHAAQLQLINTTLRAPDDAIVLAITSPNGSVVGAGTEVVRLATGATEIEAHVPQDLLIHIGENVVVRSRDGESFGKASVSAIDPAVDPATRLRIIHITLSQPPRAAFNTPVAVSFAQPAVPNAVRVPLTALTMDSVGPSVWLIAADSRTVNRKRVSIVGLRGVNALVLGVPRDARIVASGGDALYPGAVIRIVQTSSQS